MEVTACLIVVKNAFAHLVCVGHPLSMRIQSLKPGGISLRILRCTRELEALVFLFPEPPPDLLLSFSFQQRKGIFITVYLSHREERRDEEVYPFVKRLRSRRNRQPIT